MSAVKNKLLYRLSASLFFVSGLIFVVLLCVKLRQAKQAQTPSARWASVATPQELNATYNRTMELRSKWQPWATQHRLLLREMLYSPSKNDQRELMDVYNSLPGPPDYKGAGFQPSDIFTGSVQYSNCAGIERISLPKNEASNPMASKRHENAKEATKQLRQHNFITYHDIALLRSMTIGPTKYTLWVSGRITKTTQPLIAKVHRENPYLEAQEQEVASTYDFLK